MARTRISAAYIHRLFTIPSELDFTIIRSVNLLGMATRFVLRAAPMLGPADAPPTGR